MVLMLYGRAGRNGICLLQGRRGKGICLLQGRRGKRGRQFGAFYNFSRTNSNFLTTTAKPTVETRNNLWWNPATVDLLARWMVVSQRHHPCSTDNALTHPSGILPLHAHPPAPAWRCRRASSRRASGADSRDPQSATRAGRRSCAVVRHRGRCMKPSLACRTPGPSPSPPASSALENRRARRDRKSVV